MSNWIQLQLLEIHLVVLFFSWKNGELLSLEFIKNQNLEKQ